MLAVDDGIWSGNLDAADIFFLVGVILAVVAALLYAMAARPVRDPTDANRVRVGVWAPVALSLALASTALAWLVL